MGSLRDCCQELTIGINWNPENKTMSSWKQAIGVFLDIARIGFVGSVTDDEKVEDSFRPELEEYAKVSIQLICKEGLSVH
jgi:hypothetical protein